MTCTPKFDKTIDLGCVGEIIQDIRSGTAKPLSIVEKLFWVTGCGISFAKPVDGPVAMVHHSDESLVKELDAAYSLAKSSDASTKSINPEMVALLFRILERLMAKIQFVLAVAISLLFCSSANAQLLRRISMASGCGSSAFAACGGSQSIHVVNNMSCGGQSRMAASCSGSQATVRAIRMVVPRTVIRTVVPRIVVPRATMDCPDGQCPISVSSPQSGYHSHRTTDGRIITHSDSNFGNAAAHAGIPYPWFKISTPIAEPPILYRASPFVKQESYVSFDDEPQTSI